MRWSAALPWRRRSPDPGTHEAPLPFATADRDESAVDALARALAAVPRLSRVALLLHADDVVTPLPVPLEVFRGADVTVFATSAERGAQFDVGVPVVGVVLPRGVHLAMAASGPFDAVVDLGRADDEVKYRHLRWVLGHVRPGGAYVVGGVDALRGGSRPTPDAVRLALLLAQGTSGPGGEGELTEADRALAGAVESVEVGRHQIVLRRRGDLSVKVRHTELERICRKLPGPSFSRVRHEEPAIEVTSTALATCNDPELAATRYPAQLAVPPLKVREYDDVVAIPCQVLTRDRLVLPDTFRLWHLATQRSARLDEVSEFFVHTPEVPEDAPRLTGRHYYLDLEYPVHFGHVMTEGLGRLWAWHQAAAEDPELRLLVSQLLPYQEEIYRALGIAREQISVIEQPTVVESLVSPMPAFVIGSYVHPRLLEETYRRLREGLPQVASPVTVPGPEKVFLTRDRGLWRSCVNADELEEVFARRGFAVVRPEQYTLAEQAAIFREARVVAGYVGSQLYGQLFSDSHLDVIAFVSPSYTSNNEYLLATALGHTLHHFWCPEVANERSSDSTGRPIIAMHRDFRFDFARDGAALESLLDSL